jgi:16S rRNA processing protein RimM
VRPETDFPERFGRLREVRLELPTGEERRAHVTGARLTAKGVLLWLEGVTDRDQAGELRGAWVKIRKSMAEPLPEGSYYVHQILGLRAVTENGQELGEITEVIRTRANDVYVTPKAMIPALKQVVRQVDLEGGRIVVCLPPEELLGAEGPP